MADLFEDLAPYRPCVGIVLFNAEGKVFVGDRCDMEGEQWQMPQGGIDPGETPRQAALRELEEEIGTRNAEILAEHPEWIRYDVPAELVGQAWGGRYVGQAQRWFAMRLVGGEDQIDIATEHPEFEAWKWVPLSEVPSLIIPFKRPSYEAVVAAFRHLQPASARR